MNPRIGWDQPPTGWGQSYLSGWAPLVDPGPRRLQAARSIGRWLWPGLVVGGFLAVVHARAAAARPQRAMSTDGKSATLGLQLWRGGRGFAVERILKRESSGCYAATGSRTTR